MLSLANQLDLDDDPIRAAIKENINAYLSTNLQSEAYRPQIPKYGFLLHSQIVKVYPNLKVTTTLPAGDKRTPTIFLQCIADDVLLAMFDRAPNDTDFTSIIIQQPAHQLTSG